MRFLTAISKTLVSAFVILSALPGYALDASRISSKGLTNDQAQEVLRLVLRQQHISPSAALEIMVNDKEADAYPEYAAFSVTTESLQAGATTNQGLFAVSRLTADVWEINRCRRYAFDRLKKLQHRVQMRTGKTLSDERIARRNLGCGDHRSD